MLHNFDIITFDCYGTLIDWEGGISEAFRNEAARDGFDFSREEIVSAYMAEEPSVEAGEYLSYRQALADTASRVASRRGWTIKPDRKYFLAESLPQWKPFPDTNAALERLASRYKLGILSNIDDELLAETLKHFTVNFDLIVTAAQVKSYKPGHAHFLEARARLGPRLMMHAAQSYFHDVVPAKALGIPVVWVNRNDETMPDGGPKPTEEVSNLAELADLMGV